MGVDTVNSAKARVVEPVRGLLSRVVTPNVLWLSALLLLTAMLTVSSVTVVADAAGETGSRIAVTPIEERPTTRRWTTKADAEVTRVVVATTPFGRIFRVDANGYVSGAFAVYPPVGKRLLLGVDLPTLSTVLFRPAPELLGYLADSAELRVYRVREGSEVLVAADTGHRTSFLIGRDRVITSELIADWTRELTVGRADLETQADVTTQWKVPTKLSSAVELTSGDVLRAEICASGTRVGGVEVALASEPLLDVPVSADPPRRAVADGAFAERPKCTGQ